MEKNMEKNMGTLTIADTCRQMPFQTLVQRVFRVSPASSRSKTAKLAQEP